MHLVRNGGDDASDEALRDAYMRGAMDAQEQMNAEAARRKKRRRRSEYRLSAGAGSIIAGLIVAGAVIHLDVDPETPASTMQMRQEQQQGIDVVGQTEPQLQGAVVVPAPSSIQSTEPSPPPQDSGAPPPHGPAAPVSNLEPVPTLEPEPEVTAQDPSPTPSPLQRVLCRLLCLVTDPLLGK